MTSRDFTVSAIATVVMVAISLGFTYITRSKQPEGHPTIAAPRVPTTAAEMASGVGGEAACGWVEIKDLGISPGGTWIRRDAVVHQGMDPSRPVMILHDGTILRVATPDTKASATINEVDSNKWLPIDLHIIDKLPERR